jgi:hypothetical protein
MAILVSRPKREYTPAPEGTHAAVCCDVVDLGLVRTQWGMKPKVKISWQIDKKNSDNEDRPFVVSQRFTRSLHEKAELRRVLEDWRGKDLSPQELEEFDLEKLLGANCQLRVVHKIVEGGETYANVRSVAPPAAGAKLKVSPDYVRQRERQEQTLHDAPNEISDDDIPF